LPVGRGAANFFAAARFRVTRARDGHRHTETRGDRKLLCGHGTQFSRTEGRTAPDAGR